MIKPSALLLQLLISFYCCSSALAENQVVLKAMVDEMNRSIKDLHTDTHPLPYFLSYSIKEEDETKYSSCLGSDAQIEHSRKRLLTPIVKIGNYDLDSSIHLSTLPHYSVPVTVDDDYVALRRALWQSTDFAYKAAVTNFEWKKAYLNANDIPDRLPDMTKEAPSNSVTTAKPLAVNQKQWCETVQNLSACFKNYPSLQKSKVTFVARSVTRWLVNSEGTQIQDCHPVYGLVIWASGQASNGMPASDYECIAAPEEGQLPSYNQLKEITENLAKRVSALLIAPKGEEYCGPVLFEGQAAAEFFSQVMAPNLGFAEEYVGKEDWTNPLKNSLGRRVLPKYLSVIDDPKAKEFSGVPLLGGYDFDDEGVPAQKVLLVENGLLKGFCQSRLPTRHCSKSNGHSLGGHGVYSTLQLISSKTSTPEEIKRQATELAKDAGLDYILVIERMSDEYHLNEHPEDAPHIPTTNYATPSYSIQPGDPSFVYRLYLADGRKELVCGLEFKYASLRAFRDIQAVGADAYPFLVEPADFITRHLITPSYLIGELELTPVKPEHSTPPVLPSPLINP
jgi:TldD protein